MDKGLGYLVAFLISSDPARDALHDDVWLQLGDHGGDGKHGLPKKGALSIFSVCKSGLKVALETGRSDLFLPSGAQSEMSICVLNAVWG